MHFSRSNQPALLAAATGPTNATGWSDHAIAFGISHQPGGDLIGVIVFDEFRGEEAELAFAMFDGRPLSMTVIEAIRHLAFHPRTLNLKRLWARIAADDRRALSAAIRCGFEVEYRRRAGYAGGKDAILLSMDRPEPVLAPATPSDHSAQAPEQV